MTPVLALLHWLPINAHNNDDDDGGAHRRSGSRLFLLGALCFLYLILAVTCLALRYSRQELLELSFFPKCPVTDDSRRSYNIPDEIARHPGSPCIVVKI